MPKWAYGKVDAWEALASRWLGLDPDFKALSEQNKANRGTGGTHCAGTRNHNRFKEKLVCVFHGRTFIYFLRFSYLIRITLLWQCRRPI